MGGKSVCVRVCVYTSDEDRSVRTRTCVYCVFVCSHGYGCVQFRYLTRKMQSCLFSGSMNDVCPEDAVAKIMRLCDFPRHCFHLVPPQKVEAGLLAAWLDYLTGTARAAQLLTRDGGVVSALEQTMSRYLKDVRKLSVKADKVDPEFVFYDGAQYAMNAYRCV